MSVQSSTYVANVSEKEGGQEKPGHSDGVTVHPRPHTQRKEKHFLTDLKDRLSGLPTGLRKLQ